MVGGWVACRASSTPFPSHTCLLLFSPSHPSCRVSMCQRGRLADGLALGQSLKHVGVCTHLTPPPKHIPTHPPSRAHFPFSLTHREEEEEEKNKKEEGLSTVSHPEALPPSFPHPPPPPPLPPPTRRSPHLPHPPTHPPTPQARAVLRVVCLPVRLRPTHPLLPPPPPAPSLRAAAGKYISNKAQRTREGLPPPSPSVHPPTYPSFN